MSLEEQIAANTAALERLTAALQGTQLVKTTISDDGKRARAEASTPAAAPAKAPAKPETPKATEKAPPEAGDKEVTYEDAKQAVLALNKAKGSDAARAAIGSVQKGATKLPDVKPENWGAVIEACNKAMA